MKKVYVLFEDIEVLRSSFFLML